jgi:2,6-dihydroxypseudooxynicotine hydrolase
VTDTVDGARANVSTSFYAVPAASGSTFPAATETRAYPRAFRLALRVFGALKILGLRPGEPLLPRLLFAGADAGESVETLRRIRSVEDWAPAWTTLSQAHETAGRRALAGGDLTTAAESLRRAVAYLRIAEYLMPDPAGRRDLWLKLVSVCADAGECATPRVVRSTVPAAGIAVPMLLCIPDAGLPAPCVLTLGGVDGVKEEFLELFQDYAARGWASAAIDLPGQGELRRLAGVTWRPDCETVVQEVLDSLRHTPGIDPDRVAIVGGSAGGYFALRTAAVDHRLVGCGLISTPARLLDVYLQAPPPIPETMGYNLGIEDARQRRAALTAYDAEPMLGDITCPVLQIHGGRDETVAPAQADIIASGIRAELQAVRFPGGDHMCFNHRPAWEATLRQWLRTRFAEVPASAA